VPLAFGKPPKASLDVLSESVKKIRHSNSQLQATEAAINAPDPESPHQVFSVRLDDLASGAGIRHAKPVSWRYLMRSDANEIGSAEVSFNEAATKHTFAKISRGPFDTGTVETLRNIESRPEIRNGVFEPRLLKIPALQTVALWLKDQSPFAQDFIVPIAPTRSELTAGKLYRTDEFESALQGLAKMKLAKKNEESN